MVKKIVCSTALLAALMLLCVGVASAQGSGHFTPTATIGEQLVSPPSPGVLKPEFLNLLQGLTRGGEGGGGSAPPWCGPCLFWGGNGDPSNPNADGLWDSFNPYLLLNGQVYSPFVVPWGQKWDVVGLLAAIEYSPYPINVGPGSPITAVTWYIVTGMEATGNPWYPPYDILCQGLDPLPTLTDTGRLYFGFYEEYITAVVTTGCPTLRSGTYWESVTPNISPTVFQLAYESNVPDTPPPFAYGPAEPPNDSFFYSPSFGYNYFAPAQHLGPFVIFSAGVEGVAQ